MAAVVFIYLTKFGLLVRYVGMVTQKSLKYTIVNDAFQTSATIMIWYIVGWGFAFGKDDFPDTGKGGFVGASMFMGHLGKDLSPEVANKWANFLQQMGFCLISATIPFGYVNRLLLCFFNTLVRNTSSLRIVFARVVAERLTLQFSTFVTLLYAGLLYPIVCHLAWSEGGWA